MELSGYLRVLRAHWVGILIIATLGVAVAAGWVALQTRVYTADASGYVTAAGSGSSGGDTGGALLGDSLAKSKVKSYLDLGGWRTVAESAAEKLGLEASPETLVDRVAVTNPVDTVVLRVAASAATPEEARDLAQAWLEGMATEIEKIENGQITLVTGESARLPTTPTFPNVRIALFLGGLGGLILGIGYAFVRFTLDRRIRAAAPVEQETGVPVVGAIPFQKSFTVENRLIPFDGGNSSGSKNVGTFAVAEAMRELRTNLQFMNVDSPPRVIVVSSPLPGDGKSTTAANLAITLAASGQRTILVDGDLRRPMVASVFGVVGDVGLTDVLSGRAKLNDVIQLAGGSGNLALLTSGKVPPNPSELLGSDRMRDLLRTLSEQAIVIIDAPPLIPVTDGAILANRADGAFVVVGVGKTTYEILGRALRNLERANAKPLGVVLNRVPRRGAGAAYYGYQYHGDYYRSPSEQPTT